jgi:Tfp pilus assembly protein PilO
MPVITALAARAAAFLRDMSENVAMIYAEKGMAPFKKPLLVSLVILLGVYNFAYSPMRARIEARSAELDKWRIIEAHYSEYESASDRMRAYQARLPNLKDKEEWLNVIMYSTAKTYGITPDSLAAQTEIKAGNFLLVSRDVSLTTTYAQFGRWLADVENSPILLRVADVKIAKVDGQSGYVRVNLRLSTIYPKNEAAEGQGGV